MRNNVIRLADVSKKKKRKQDTYFFIGIFLL